MLDAIDWCLGSRRSLPVGDADFFRLDVSRPIRIRTTVGELPDALKSIESYGSFLRGFDHSRSAIDDEPGAGLEDVLTIEVEVDADLEPRRRLVSDRADAQGLVRSLPWADRERISPARIGSFAARHLTWQRGSLLHGVADEALDVRSALAATSREARERFGDQASEQLADTLAAVGEAAARLGVEGAIDPRAMLDPDAVSISGGAITLHDRDSVPLGRLGLGSSRLLVAGLQGATANAGGIVLVDEVEHGLEPHRIARFLIELGAKAPSPSLQVFLTSHSPFVLRELRAGQLHVVRRTGDELEIRSAGAQEGLQGPLRASAEALLGVRVLVCEGATEVGLVRGLDLARDDAGDRTLMAAGTVLVDAGGVDKIYAKARSFQLLGYQTAVLRDDDKKPDASAEQEFVRDGGRLFHWGDGQALEDALLSALPTQSCIDLCRFAASVHGKEKVRENLRSASSSGTSFKTWCEEIDTRDPDRSITAKAAKSGGWFKRIDIMEEASRLHVAPVLSSANGGSARVMANIVDWALGG